MHASLTSKIVGIALGPRGNALDARDLTELLSTWDRYFAQRRVAEAEQNDHFDRIMRIRTLESKDIRTASILPPSD